MEPTNNGGSWQDVPNSGAAPTPQNPGSPYPPPSQAYPPPPAGYPPQPQGGYPPQPPPGYGAPAGGGMSPNTAAALSYLTFIPAIIFLMIEPYKRIPLVRFHAMQCIALTVCSFAVGVVLAIVGVVLAFAHLGVLIFILGRIINLLFFIAWLACIIQASQGKWFKLPIIGDFAMKQAQNQ